MDRINKLADTVTAAMQDLLRRNLSPIMARLKALDDWRASVGEVKGQKGDRGNDGIRGEPGTSGERGEPGEKGERGIEGPKGQDGEAGQRGEPGPAGEKGDPGERGEKGDPGPAGELGRAGEKGLDGAAGAPGERGPQGERGKDADPVLVAELVAKTVEQQMPGLLEKAIERLMPELVAKAAMLVPPGRDGMPGAPGRPGDRGEDGTNGTDGLGLDDFDAEIKDGRSLVLRLRGAGREIVREINLQGMPLDRGVFKAGRAYEKGDGVTYGGSFFIAQRDTEAAPETNDHWRLAVKRGRDAKA